MSRDPAYGTGRDLRPTGTPARLFRLLVALTLFAGCCAPSRLREPSATERSDAGRAIYLINLGWHTGIAIRRADIPVDSWPESEDFPNAEYLEVGWGDRGFYMAPDFSLWLALKALLVPTDSVLHVVGLPVHPTAYFPSAEILEIPLSERQLKQIVRYIHDTYAHEGAAKASAIAPGLYPDSRFYPAVGKFHIFNTCNVWVADALRSAGFPVAPLLSLTSDELLCRARKFGKIVRPESEGR
ncbi:DUF2459 domain-containing protein [Methylocaldum sp. MU1018]